MGEIHWRNMPQDLPVQSESSVLHSPPTLMKGWQVPCSKGDEMFARHRTHVSSALAHPEISQDGSAVVSGSERQHAPNALLPIDPTIGVHAYPVSQVGSLRSHTGLVSERRPGQGSGTHSHVVQPKPSTLCTKPAGQLSHVRVGQHTPAVVCNPD
jgi:hypothetical protein